MREQLQMSDTKISKKESDRNPEKVTLLYPLIPLMLHTSF